METIAAIKALEVPPADAGTALHSDSRIAINGTSEWLRSCRHARNERVDAMADAEAEKAAETRLRRHLFIAA